MTLTPIITAEPFNDSDGDGIIKLGAANVKKHSAALDGGRVSTIIYQGLNAAGESIYWPKGYAPPVAPPVEPPVVVAPPPPPPPPSPPPPPVTGTEALVAGEAFLQSDTATVGFNVFGGIGTTSAASEGFRTDTATGLKRVGFYTPPRNDVILQGRAVEGFAIFIDGKRYANAMLNGQTQIPGKFIDAHRWLGEVAGVQVLQRVVLDGAKLSFVVELTNNTLRTITLGYMRFADPDQSSDNAGGTANFGTTSTAVAGGVECDLYGGGAVYLRDVAGKATVRTAASVNKAADLGTVLATGKTLKSDHVVQLVFETVTLLPGQSVVHSFEMGVR